MLSLNNQINIILPVWLYINQHALYNVYTGLYVYIIMGSAQLPMSFNSMYELPHNAAYILKL